MFRKNALLLIALCSLVLSAPVFATDDFDAQFRAYEAAVDAGNRQEAVTLARWLYEQGPETYGEGSEEVAALALDYGIALDYVGELETSRDVLEEARQRFAAIDERHPRLIEVHLALGKSWSKSWNRESKARAQYGRAMKLAEKLYGKGSVEAVVVELRVGADMLEVERSRRAGSYLEDAWEVLDRELGETDQKTGEAAFYLGKFELFKERPEKAEPWFDLALAAFTEEDEVNQQLRMTTHAFLVAALEGQGKSDEATEHCLIIGQMSPADPNQARQPLFKTRPDMVSLLTSDLTSKLIQEYDGKGRLTFAFTVDEMGFVRDPQVLENNLNDAFVQAGLETISTFRYAPRFIDGEAVPSEDTYSMNFEITQTPR